MIDFSFRSTDKKQQDLGEFLFEWEAFDYQPHKRGVLWYIVFCAVFFGGAIWSILSDPKWGWLTAFVFAVAVSVYFWKHLQLGRTHLIKVFPDNIQIDTDVLPLKNISGYWFLVDKGVSVINLELKDKKNRKITLQMGERSVEWFRSQFLKVEISELEDRSESLLDLWIRALKL